jgi:transposase
LVGIKGYVTNAPLPDKKVIEYYHQLWHVEQSFRMTKSDLKARPIFHRKKDAIEAHLTIIMATLAIGKNIESASGMSLKQVIKALRPIRSGTVVIGGKTYQAQAIVPQNIQTIVDNLFSGH